MTFHFDIPIGGRYKLEAIRLDENGKEVSRRLLADWFSNLIVNQGLDRFGANASFLNYCRVGTGNTAPSNTDTNLVSQVWSTATIQTTNGTTTASSPYYSSRTTPLSQLYTELRDLQASREPFTIVTGKRVYSNMLFKSIAVTTDITKENILSVIGNFQEVILVDVVNTTVPVRSKQKMPEQTDSTQNTGDKKAIPVDESKVDVSGLSGSLGRTNINGA